MGGRGSGGGRVGAGRKSKSDGEKWLGGDANVHGSPRARPNEAPVKLIPAPSDMSGELVAIWNELAPHACGNKTLVEASVQSFRDLVEAIALRRLISAELEGGSLTYVKVTVDGSGQEHTELKANPLLGHLRGQMQRVEAGLARFKLAPTGKALVESEAPVDPFSQFDSAEASH